MAAIRYVTALVRGAVAVALATAAVSGFLLLRSADTAATLRAGRTLYLANCASCHGTELEGQPDWQTPLPDGRLPAPPHDETGHTWHHPDDILFAIVKFGTGALMSGQPSTMPPFAEVLTDGDIELVLAFIKSSWPAPELAYQQARTREREAAGR